MTYTKDFAKQTSHAGIDMVLIGQWQDLAAYYAGSDGNAWCWQGRWSNEGPLPEFRATFNQRRRGQLTEGAI